MELSFIGNSWSAIAAQMPGRTDNEIKNVWHTHLKKRLDDDRKVGDGDGRQQRKPKSKSAAAKAVDHEQFTASPGRSSNITTSSGVTCSTVTESAAAVSSSADNAATTSASHSGHQHQLVKEESFSSAEFPIPPIIDESFWSSTDVTGMMDLGGAMDEELSLTSSSARNEDMEFWLKTLLEAGDMRDLTVL